MSNGIESQALTNIIENNIQYAEKYFRITNDILGILSLTLGMACFSTDNPKFYAFVCIIFVIFYWIYSFYGFRHRLEMLDALNHEVMKPGNVLKNTVVALLGAGFLICVANEILVKTGFNI